MAQAVSYPDLDSQTTPTSSSLQAGYKSWRHPNSRLLGTTYPRPTQRLRCKLMSPRWHHHWARNLQAGRSEARDSPNTTKPTTGTRTWTRTYPWAFCQTFPRNLSLGMHCAGGPSICSSSRGWRHIYGLLGIPVPDRAALSHFSARIRSYNSSEVVGRWTLNPQRIPRVRTTRIQSNMHEWIINHQHVHQWE